MADMDVTGAEEIVALFEELQASNVDMWLVRLHSDARITADKAGVIDVIGDERVFATLRLAGDRFSTRDTREDRADHDSSE
jgi:hypothetical protein